MRLIVIGLMVSGCYIVEPGAGDDMPAPPNGEGPVGRTFPVARVPTSADCPEMFTQENQSHTIDVSANDVFVSGGDFASAVTVRADPAREADSDPPNVLFTVTESWSTPDPFLASPDVHYELWISGNELTGEANATFQFLQTVCDYTWRVP